MPDTVERGALYVHLCESTSVTGDLIFGIKVTQGNDRKRLGRNN